MTDPGAAFQPSVSALPIRPLATDAEVRACAEIMSRSDPWVTLGRTFEESCRILRDPAREVHVALEREWEGEGAGDAATPRVAGFTIIIMQGPFVGYIQSVAVHERWRGKGLGTALIAFAERRILRDQPNVFICVSSFNARARRLYERLGYEVVGELKDFVVRGHSEFLLRKTTGPLAEHVPWSDRAEDS